MCGVLLSLLFAGRASKPDTQISDTRRCPAVNVAESASRPADEERYLPSNASHRERKTCNAILRKRFIEEREKTIELYVNTPEYSLTAAEKAEFAQRLRTEAIWEYDAEMIITPYNTHPEVVAAIAKFFSPGELQAVRDLRQKKLSSFYRSRILKAQGEACMELSLNPKQQETINTVIEEIGFEHVSSHPDLSDGSRSPLEELTRQKPVSENNINQRVAELFTQKFGDLLNSTQIAQAHAALHKGELPALKNLLLKQGHLPLEILYEMDVP